ncbi:uncharacterized protein LOC130095754 [Rhinichthys klamathensis goyatoka]|uniref:uncharacterized protein LOC130095754 n=1 Tax=Rhinichthys klamathensis goyatoka TaxID=3034132 RepID=UPI0024B574FA|nr:uncharacterized protein LOC130095754 [Rhinichthys klamathensis goyatoka]
MDGLARWNEDRAVVATTDEQQPHSYNHLHAVNTLAEEVMGKKIIPYVGPRKYTGELIGVEYLYQQTGKVLQDYKLAIEESETTEVGIEVDEGYAELEEFQDITVPTFDTERTPVASSQASVSAASSPTPPVTSSISSLSVVPPSPVTSPVTSSISSLSVVPPSPVTSPVNSSISSLSVVPPSPVTSVTCSISSLSVAPPSPVTSPLHSHSKPGLFPGAHSCEFTKVSI